MSVALGAKTTLSVSRRHDARTIVMVTDCAGMSLALSGNGYTNELTYEQCGAGREK